jgi:hypothetical protein
MKALLLTPLAFLPLETTLHLAPEAGATLHKHYQSSLHLEGGDLAVMMGGQEVPPEYLPDLDIEMDITKELAFTDRYLRVADGRVLDLVRAFGDLREQREGLESMVGQSMDSENETSTSGVSPLEGERVRFRWDDEAEEYGVAFEDDEDGDGALLEGLAAGADLAAFLPENGVSEGDSWTVPAEAFGQLFAPGGDLAFEYTGDGADRMGAGESEVSFEGELELTFRGENSRDGSSVATVLVEGEVTVVVITPSDLADVPMVEGDATLTWTQVHTLEGELYWNLDGAHLAAIELSSEVEATMFIQKDPENAGPSFESTITFAGEASFSATFGSED